MDKNRTLGPDEGRRSFAKVHVGAALRTVPDPAHHACVNIRPHHRRQPLRRWAGVWLLHSLLKEALSKLRWASFRTRDAPAHTAHVKGRQTVSQSVCPSSPPQVQPGWDRLTAAEEKGRTTVCAETFQPQPPTLHQRKLRQAGGRLYKGSVSSRCLPLCTLSKQFLKAPREGGQLMPQFSPLRLVD